MQTVGRAWRGQGHGELTRCALESSSLRECWSAAALHVSVSCRLLGKLVLLLLPDSRRQTLGPRPALAAGDGGHEIRSRNPVWGGCEGDTELAEKWYVHLGPAEEAACRGPRPQFSEYHLLEPSFCFWSCLFNLLIFFLDFCMLLKGGYQMWINCLLIFQAWNRYSIQILSSLYCWKISSLNDCGFGYGKIKSRIEMPGVAYS